MHVPGGPFASPFRVLYAVFKSGRFGRECATPESRNKRRSQHSNNKLGVTLAVQRTRHQRVAIPPLMPPTLLYMYTTVKKPSRTVHHLPQIDSDKAHEIGGQVAAIKCQYGLPTDQTRKRRTPD